MDFGQISGFWIFPSKTTLYTMKEIRGRSKKLRTTRGIISRQGSERIRLDKSVKNQQKHLSTNILKMSLNRCPYFALKIPLCGLSNFCVMFLCVLSVSTLGNTREEYVFSRRGDGLHLASPRPQKPPIWEPPKSTSIHPQLYSHSLT